MGGHAAARRTCPCRGGTSPAPPSVAIVLLLVSVRPRLQSPFTRNGSETDHAGLSCAAPLCRAAAAAAASRLGSGGHVWLVATGPQAVGVVIQQLPHQLMVALHPR